MRREALSFRARLTGAALLRRSVYEDVVADDATTGQAVGVVVLASLAQGFAVFGEPGGVAVLLIALAILLAAFRVALGFMDFFLFHHSTIRWLSSSRCLAYCSPPWDSARRSGSPSAS